MFPIISQEKEFISGYWSNESEVLKIKKPVVIFGDHTKVLKYVDFDFVLGADGVKVLQPKSFVEAKYLFYYLQAFPLKALGYARHFRILKEVEVRYPLDVGEQKRIVAILDAAFEGIDTAIASAEQNLDKARALFESQREVLLRNLAAICTIEKLSENIDLQTGFAFKSKEYTDHASGMPLLRGDNIVQGRFRWEGVKRWPADDVAKYANLCLRENDIVIAMDRTWVSAGIKFAQVTADDLPCLLVQRVARLRCRPTLNHRFLFHLIGGKSFEAYVLSIQTGLGVPHISGKQIESFEIPIPPVETQISTARRLDNLERETSRLADTYAAKAAALIDLKQSLLHRAFSGGLETGCAEKVAEAAVQAVA